MVKPTEKTSMDLYKRESWTFQVTDTIDKFRYLPSPHVFSHMSRDHDAHIHLSTCTI